MVRVWKVLLLVLVMSMCWIVLGAPSATEEGPVIAPKTGQPDVFSNLGTLGEIQARGQARIVDGVLEISCSMPTLPADIGLMLAVPRDMWRTKPPIRAGFSFEFPYSRYLRAGRVGIQTNLPAVPAVVNVDSQFFAGHKPLSNLLLEYELLAATRRAGEGTPLSITFLVRARLVRLYDDAALAFCAGIGEDGPTWLKGTPVYAPFAFASKEVGKVEARPAQCYPWAYAIIPAPPGAEEWFVVTYVQGTPEEPRILYLVRGYYEEPPGKWANDLGGQRAGDRT